MICCTVGSLTSPRPRDLMPNAVRHRRDRPPESAQCDSKTISCTVALCFSLLFSLFYSTGQKVFSSLKRRTYCTKNSTDCSGYNEHAGRDCCREKSLWFVLEALRRKLIDQSIKRESMQHHRFLPIVQVSHAVIVSKHGLRKSGVAYTGPNHRQSRSRMTHST